MDFKMYYDGALDGLSEGFVRMLEEFIKECEYVVIGTVTQEGGVRLSALNNIPGQQLSGLWFGTGIECRKARNLSLNPACEIMMTNGQGQLMLGGVIHIVTDSGLKKEKWQPWMEEHFKSPESEQYCLLHFIPSYVRAMLP